MYPDVLEILLMRIVLFLYLNSDQAIQALCVSF